MEKKITVADFVKGYTQISNDKNKEMFIKKHFVDKYIPYEEKCSICKRIIDASMTTDVAGKKVFRQDTTARYMLYSLNIIDLYTDITIDYTKALEQFNLLDKYNLIDVLYLNIPGSDKQKMDTILQMKLDDYYENERSTTGFIEKVYNRFSSVVKEFVERFNENIDEYTSTQLRETLKRKIIK